LGPDHVTCAIGSTYLHFPGPLKSSALCALSERDCCRDQRHKREAKPYNVLFIHHFISFLVSAPFASHREKSVAAIQ
jgi:hypothetical protein